MNKIMQDNIQALTDSQVTQIEQIQVMERLNMLSRLALQGTTHNGKRDLYQIFGYKEQLSHSDFAFSFKRGDIANRIVTAYPDAVWTNRPEILDDPDAQEMTEFENATVDLFTNLKIWSYLRRADVLASLGRFSVLLLGYSGVGDPKVAPSSGAEIKYFMPYGEANVRVHTYEKDIRNERFGKPLTYMITILDVSQGKHQSQSTPNTPNGGREIEVHYKRVMHFAEGLLDNEVYGTPILEKVYNKLADLDKVVGGGAEVYWINSRGGLNLNADKDTSIKDPEALTESAENYVNQLSRILKTQGIDVKPLQFTTESPKDQFEAIISLIAGSTGIPKRILLGSEEGKLASTQDEDNWCSRVIERRVKYNEPEMLRPIIDLFIEIGMLPTPKSGKYIVKWPELLTSSDKDKADIAVKVAQAISAYVNAPGADMILTPKKFVIEILGMPYLENEIAQIEEEHSQEDEEQRLLELEGEDANHQRQIDLAKAKTSNSAATGGLGGGGKNDKGNQIKTRFSEPGSASPKSTK